IWTTTPWTLPANRAISLNPEFKYQLVEADGDVTILAADLVKDVMTTAGVESWKVLGECDGSALELLRFQHPFMGFDVPAI
ncbi:class I tRNA ligase family protein, partial [Vibrio parahaemolyticus]